MTDYYALLFGFIAVWWLIENRDRIRWPLSEPTSGLYEIGEPDWIHSVTKKYADPPEDFAAGYIDRYEYAARMAALKRYITPSHFGLIGPTFANHERVVRAVLADK